MRKGGGRGGMRIYSYPGGGARLGTRNGHKRLGRWSVTSAIAFASEWSGRLAELGRHTGAPFQWIGVGTRIDGLRCRNDGRPLDGTGGAEPGARRRRRWWLQLGFLVLGSLCQALGTGRLFGWVGLLQSLTVACQVTGTDRLEEGLQRWKGFFVGTSSRRRCWCYRISLKWFHPAYFPSKTIDLIKNIDHSNFPRLMLYISKSIKFQLKLRQVT